MATNERDMESRSVRLLRLEAEAVLSCLEDRQKALLASIDPSTPNRIVMQIALKERTILDIMAKIEKAFSK